MDKILSILLLFSLISPNLCLYFHIQEKEEKCFIEEIPIETPVIGSYKIETFNNHIQAWEKAEHPIGMHVTITGPDRKVIQSRDFSTEGRFSFTSNYPGEHSICLRSTTDQWFAGIKLRIHLDLQSGEHAVNYDEVATKEKLTDMQLRMRKLLEHVEQINREQDYQRLREERFRYTSESTNARVLWWSLGQVIIVLVIGFLQMRHLKSFFEAKKLV
ncbi:Transmembrane emp24 domain-containing protein eca-like [Oopsacas minuta]|uniref:Transmembrane emp24 domain-containing protein eca-like n=1 Tax=Oopsacas minuta TaxID=111878 RepID=A0AAV7JCB5_9METZ|nr:Transmembrane emp24 domain-containing protein eca-like [Oopsacas minuta]